MYTFYWLDGKRELLEGDSIPDAFRKSGYGAGAMSAIDFICNGDNKEYYWNKTKQTWVKRKVKPICSYNTDWYQWGLNCQILGYDESTQQKIIKDGVKYYEGTQEDIDLFKEGYYS